MALASLPSLARANGEVVECHYGDAVRFGERVLKFPDFTLQFLKRSELSQIGTTQPWIVTVFEVLDSERKSIGGDLRFNSEKRANARRFDVHRKMYIAEMAFSTGSAKSGDKASRHEIPEQEIIIWDEASAAARNPTLLALWKNPKFDAHFSSQNAYADGVWLPEFTDTSGMGSSGLVPAPILPFDRLPPKGAVVKASLGVPVDYRDRLMEFPDFKICLFEHETIRSDATGRPRTNYKFRIYSKSAQRIDQLLIRSEAFGEGNARSFEFEGQIYLLEMHHTTAGLPADFQSGDKLPTVLPENQLVIWSKTSAGGNPRILKVWPSEAAVSVTKVTKNSSLAARNYAAGAALSPVPPSNLYPGLTMSFADRLDASPWLINNLNVVYPPEFRGSGLIGHVTGGAMVLPDGSVARVDVLSGNDQRFAAAAREAMTHWRFTPPKKSGQIVRAVLAFSMEIFDDPVHPQEFTWSPSPSN